MIPIIDDPYHCVRCDLCNRWEIAGDPFDSCDYDLHHSCRVKSKQNQCPKCRQPLTPKLFQNGTVIVLTRNQISEIPNWTHNTRHLIDQYPHPSGSGYLFTGVCGHIQTPFC